MDVTITAQQLAEHQFGHVIAIVALLVLATIAWTRDPSCPSCDHCRRLREEEARRERAFWKHAAGKHDDCDHK